MSTHEWDERVAQTNGDRATEYIKLIQAQAADLQTRLDRCEALLYDERVKSFALECIVAQKTKDNALLGEMCDRAIARNIARVVAEGTPGPGVTLHGMASKWLPGPSGLDENDIIGFA